ncbi:DUF1345 domain-containing protein [Rhizobium straminoryzae]|uniref:DUF1345 domain-containing protein n=1 Tax=Rhizobium straminoryzae TaxID=1387186 RepID=A0A549SQ49_9HYPH|nr:DUF1345 domain-containing protein [Rhizobium straminoryzae]TRL31729.1 DUF1345 domain-containing protein [Rhizobium straminoryzae]
MTELPNSWRHRRQSPFYMAGLAGLVPLPILLVIVPRLAIELSVILFFLVYLGSIARRIPHLTVNRLKTSRERDDAPAYTILVVTLLAVVASVGALFNALNRSHDPSLFEVVIAFASVIGGWLTIHTMFAMHYAHHYWRRVDDGSGGLMLQGGLSFPETKEPAGYDFLYFSLVIGMTAQTSDVAITTTTMRRINLAHAVLAFFFNTILVAAAVNAVVSLAG